MPRPARACTAFRRARTTPFPRAHPSLDFLDCDSPKNGLLAARYSGRNMVPLSRRFLLGTLDFIFRLTFVCMRN